MEGKDVGGRTAAGAGVTPTWASRAKARLRRLRPYHRKGRAVVLPVRVKPVLMTLLPWRVWKHVVYPVWLRWYKRALASRRWRTGGYDPGQTARWRGVRLVCCTSHFVGDQAEHPWDPGSGWPTWKANALWEPARKRDRLLLSFVGDPRSRAAGPERPEVAHKQEGPSVRDVSGEGDG